MILRITFHDSFLQTLQIHDSRLRAQMFEFTKTTLQFGQLADAALRVTEIAKGDGACWASLGTCRDDFAIFYRVAFGFSGLLALANALYAKRAFFHDPTPAHRHIGVEIGSHGFRVFPVEPIEDTRRIRAVIPAVTRANTAVINL